MGRRDGTGRRGRRAARFRIPAAEAWVGAAVATIGALGPEAAVVAHSLGCVTAVRAVERLAAGGAGGSLGAFVAVSPFVEPLTHTGDEGLDAFARSLQVRTVVVPGARHFLTAHGITELPEVVDALTR